LRGEHQVGNAAVAVAMLEATREVGVRIPDAAIRSGLESVDWPGRLELLTLSNGAQVLLDAAHNPEGAHALRQYLRRWHPERPSLVIGVMRDKDVDGILRELLPATSAVIATGARTARALPAAELAARVRTLDPHRVVLVREDAASAIDSALTTDATLCVAGSIFLAGEVRERLLPLLRGAARGERRDILR
jgi:dihydrofolate synthase/folylpolyglutamate synthase